MIINETEMREALSRIGLTPDGEVLYLWLQRRLTGLLHSTEPGALQRDQGARILAHELMHLLCAGITEDHARVRADRAVYFEHSVPAPERGDWIARRRARLFGPGVEPGGSAGGDAA